MPNLDVLDGLRRRIDEMEQRHARELAELRDSLKAMEAPEPLEPEPAPEVRQLPPPLPVQQPVWESEVETEIEPEPEPEPIAPTSPPPPPSAAREIDFGRVWFVRIGVVILLTGLVFLGNYAYQNWIRELSSGVRLAALFALAALWVEAGRRLAMRDHLRRFGEVVMAGGLGFSYYCVYAAHHVERLRVIENPLVAGGLLVAAAVGIAAVSWRRQSHITAMLGVLLASYTTVVQPLGWLACVSNGALACTGLFFLTRRGWAAPGWVAMLGMYASFGLWQTFGASGGSGDAVATLWFLAPSWLVFAAAGVMPRCGTALSDRARAWFAGANNALFFVIFGALWLDLYGSERFWMVAGVLAVVLMALGLIGRRTMPAAGSANLGQGLLLLGVALILKLDGFHLALAFAIESMVLAAAYRRFGGRVEVVFALLAGIAAAGWMWLASHQPPVWSAAVALLPLGAATWLMRGAAEQEMRRSFREFARLAAGGLFWSGLFVFVVGVVLRVEVDFSHGIVAVGALALGLGALYGDPNRRMVELAYGAAVLGLLAFFWMFYHGLEHHIGGAAALLAMVPHVAGAWLWRAEVANWNAPLENPRDDPRLVGWLHALGAVAALGWLCADLDVAPEMRLLLTLGAALGMAALAMVLRTGRIGILTGALALTAVVGGWISRESVWNGDWVFFVSAPLALVVLPMWFGLPAGDRIERRARVAGAAMFRAAAFLAWALALHFSLEDYAFDGMAVTAMGVMISSIFRRIKLPAESLVFLGIAAFGLLFHFVETPWSRTLEHDDWRGAAVVVALGLLLFSYRQRTALIANPKLRAQLVSLLAISTCLIATLWATQMLVWRHGWDGTVALWSAVGLLTVSAGLWQRLRALRVAGLLLLLVALSKLFAFDVWDYTAFTRVLSFIALGAVLILLGLFYNHFAHTLKKWL